MHGVLVGKTYTKHEREKDKLRMGGGSWSINLSEIKPETEVINYITEDYTYTISFHKAVEKGFTRVLGGEEKLVVPITHWARNTK